LNKNAILESFSFIETRKELIEQLFGFCIISISKDVLYIYKRQIRGYCLYAK
jgi:hypothetical protein